MATDNPLIDFNRSLGNVVQQSLTIAANEIIPVVKKRITGNGKHGSGDSFSTPYSKSHGRRRSNTGLQTSYKNLNFSGSMFDGFKITDTETRFNGATVTISFDGAHRRRSDQSPASKQQVANWLGEQEDKNIIALSNEEINRVSRRVEDLVPNLLQNLIAQQ